MAFGAVLLMPLFLLPWLGFFLSPPKKRPVGVFYWLIFSVEINCFHAAAKHDVIFVVPFFCIDINVIHRLFA